MALVSRQSEGRLRGSAAAVLRRRVGQEIQQAAITIPERFFDFRNVSAMAWLRAYRPLAKLGARTVVVTRREDVLGVLADSATYPSPYSEGLAGNFVLGQSGDDFARHRRVLDTVLDDADLPWLEDLAGRVARARVDGADPAGMAVGREVVRPVLQSTVADYLGLRRTDFVTLLSWSRAIFQDIFLNNSRLPYVHLAGVRAVEQLKADVRAELEARRSEPTDRDDVLGRLLAMHETPGGDRFTEAEIVDSMVGLAIGWLWHGAKASLLAVDGLLERPEALALAQQAARSGDGERVRRVLWEALRFRPVQVGLPRTCPHDTRLAVGTPRETEVPAGAFVLVGTHSAMWDDTAIPDPRDFDPTRADQQYLIFGHGDHRCMGESIIRRQLPAMLMPLLALDSLERVPGRRGRLSWAGPSPDDLRVRFRR